jgi:hypothetical protein
VTRKLWCLCTFFHYAVKDYSIDAAKAVILLNVKSQSIEKKIKKLKNGIADEG